MLYSSTECQAVTSVTGSVAPYIVKNMIKTSKIRIPQAPPHSAILSNDPPFLVPGQSSCHEFSCQPSSNLSGPNFFVSSAGCSSSRYRTGSRLFAPRRTNSHHKRFLFDLRDQSRPIPSNPDQSRPQNIFSEIILPRDLRGRKPDRLRGRGRRRGRLQANFGACRLC